MKTLFTLIMLLTTFVLSTTANAKIEGKNLANGSSSESGAIDQSEENDFVGSFTMNVTQYKKGTPTKDSPMKVSFYFKGDQIAFVSGSSRGQDATMIYDLKGKVMTTLINKDGEKTGMKMKIPASLLREEDTDKLDVTITPTDEKKTIEGYSCRKYLTDSEENSGYVWVTEDVDLDYDKIFSFLNDKQKKSNTSMPSLRDLKGFALEAYSKSKKKDESFEMKVSNLVIGETNEEIFDTSDYAITDMSSLMNFGGGE